MANPLIGQKFQINDPVTKQTIGGTSVPLKARTGNIKNILKKKNSAGREYFYYEIQWSDSRTSVHAQHVLRPLPKTK